MNRPTGLLLLSTFFTVVACAGESEPTAKAEAEVETSEVPPPPGSDVLHAVIELTFSEEGTLVRSVRLGLGSAPGAANDDKPIRVVLVDAEGHRIDELGFADWRDLRVYAARSDRGSPDAVQRVTSSDTWISVPVDPSLEVVFIVDRSSGQKTEIPLAGLLLESCKREPSTACELWGSRR